MTALSKRRGLTSAGNLNVSKISLNHSVMSQNRKKQNLVT